MVTVITIIYNREKNLEQTIQSVLNQTYDNVEYIIIDGGSIDNTIATIQNYEKYIDYWISESDDGIYDAMNKGIDLAKGKWINFMNCSDKFYNKNLLSNIFNKVYNRNVKIICGDREFVSGKKRMVREVRKVYKKKTMLLCHQSVFVKLEIMKNYKFKTKFKIMADRFLFFHLYFNEGNTAYCSNEIISTVQLYGYSNISIVKSRKELNYILKEYVLINNLMACLLLIYAYIKDYFNYIFNIIKKF